MSDIRQKAEWAATAVIAAGLLLWVRSCVAPEHRTSPNPAAAAIAARAEQPRSEPVPAPVQRIATVGDVVTLSDSVWTVVSAKDLGAVVKSNNQFVEDLKSEGARYIAVVFKVVNTGSKEERIFADPKVRDRLGREYSAHDRSSFFLPKGKKSMQLEAVPAGLPKEFWAIYEVPANSTGLQLLARELKFRAQDKPIDLGL
jgi:hypothetical protein